MPKNADLDSLLAKLLEITDCIRHAAAGSEIDSLNRYSEERGRILKRLSPLIPVQNPTPQEKRLMHQILESDQTARQACENLFASFKREVETANKKIDGLQRYNSSYQLSYGHLFDKSR